MTAPGHVLRKGRNDALGINVGLFESGREIKEVPSLLALIERDLRSASIVASRATD